MKDALTSAEQQVHACAVAYCEAVYKAKTDVFADMCHDRFQMTAIGESGAQFWDKAAYLERVAGREPFPGEPTYGIYTVDVAGDEIARAHLWVDVPPVRYEDHLGFVRVGGEWKLLTKVFRTMSDAEREG